MYEPFDPTAFSDFDRKCMTILTIENLMIGGIVCGENIIRKLDEKDAEMEKQRPRFKDQEEYKVERSFDVFLTDSFVFSLYRITRWVDAFRRAQGIPKNSQFRELLKIQKQVRELRDYLMHNEEYIVAGTGKKPKRYFTSLGFSVSDPTSTMYLRQCQVGPQYIERALFLGNKLEFFSVFSLLVETYKGVKSEGFFDLSKISDDDKTD